MTAHRFGLIIVAMFLAASPSFAQLRAKARYTPLPSLPGFLDHVALGHREAVSNVVKAPTLTTRATEEAFACSVATYAWMLDNPDRVCLAWQRLDVPCVDITSVGHRKYTWSDSNGSKVVWEPVAKLDDGIVWYATGQVKPSAIFPMVPVKAVAVLRYPGTPTAAAGVNNIKPELQVYFQTDSRAANVVLKMIGPAAPKLAEDAAGQLLYFFSGIAKYCQQNPGDAKILLMEKR